MVKLLFLDMDGAGANSWNDIEKYWNAMRRKGLSRKEISKAYDKKFKDGLEAIFPGKAKRAKPFCGSTNAQQHRLYKQRKRALQEQEFDSLCREEYSYYNLFFTA